MDGKYKTRVDHKTAGSITKTPMSRRNPMTGHSAPRPMVMGGGQFESKEACYLRPATQCRRHVKLDGCWYGVLLVTSMGLCFGFSDRRGWLLPTTSIREGLDATTATRRDRLEASPRFVKHRRLSSIGLDGVRRHLSKELQFFPCGSCASFVILSVATCPQDPSATPPSMKSWPA